MKKHATFEKSAITDIVVNQHIIPEASIKRFRNQKGFVTVTMVTSGRKFPSRKRKESIFCVQRLWSNSAESKWGYDIEKSFQEFVDNKCLENPSYSLEDSESKIVSKMYLLISARLRSALNPQTEEIYNKPKVNYLYLGQVFESSAPIYMIDEAPFCSTKYGRDRAEREHLAVKDEKGNFPRRFIYSSYISRHIKTNMNKGFSQLKWHLISSTGEDFILSDHYGDVAILPLTPKLCFIGGFTGDKMDISSETVNSLGKENARVFYIEAE